MITIVDLNYSQNIYPLLSKALLDNISKASESWWKVMIYFNRRWESTALFCKDCWYMAKCKYCDIPFSIHRYPSNKLICHQCDASDDLPDSCPKCKSKNLIWVWTWIQKIEDHIKRTFPNKRIIRLDSDKAKKEWVSYEEIKNSDIIIATQMANAIWIDWLKLLAIPLFEAELSIPEYDIEEQIYSNIMLNVKRWADVIIQSYTPNHDLLKIIANWNYNDFLKYTLSEREKFNYPPFVDMAKIVIRSKNMEKVRHLSTTIFNKLGFMDEEKRYIINFNEEKIARIWEDYIKSIIIRWKDLQKFIENVEFDIARNREVSLEWK